MIEVEVVEPIVEAKKEQAWRAEGLLLADADLVRTSVLVDLGYVERKLKRTIAELDNRQEALAQLALAQSDGVKFVVNKEDHPLLKAERAIKLAQRMAKDKKYEAAKKNLELANIYLQTYRGIVGEQAGEKVKKLEEDITKTLGGVMTAKTAEAIGSFWDQAASWFRQQPGQTHETTSGKEKGK
jgi:hypothetical protein